MKQKLNANRILPIVGLIIVFIYLFPIYWMVISSFKETNEIFAAIPTFFPAKFTLKSYSDIFSPQYGFFKYIRNSTIISTATTVLTLIICTPAAYGLARKKIKGFSLILGFVLIIQMFPPSVLALPLFSFFSKLHLTNSYLGIVLANMTITVPFVIVVMRTFFVSLPKDLEAAALVDGCSSWGSFLRIIIPISKTGIATCAAFSFVFSWGEFMYSLILLTDQEFWPITLGIRQFSGQFGTQWGSMMAVSTMSSLPVIVIFLLAQKYIVSGVTTGSIKG